MSTTSLHTTTGAAAKPIQLHGRRRTSRFGEGFRAFGRALQARHDDWTRRELDAGHTARARRYETGGDFSILP